MCCCAKAVIKGVGLTLLILFLISSSAGVIFTLLDYSSFNSSLLDLKWKPFSAFQLACVIYCTVLSILGFFVFCCTNTCFVVFYSILLMLGFISMSVVGGLSLVAGQFGWIKDYLSCQTKWSGLLDSYKAVDKYLANVDQYLCSDQCICYIDSRTIDNYKKNTTFIEYLSKWNTKDNSTYARNFMNCTVQVQNIVLAKTVSSDTSIYENSISPRSLFSFIGNLEKTYKCSGFCNTVYYNSFTKSKMLMAKYLFTNINNGPPENIGCFKFFVRNLPAYLRYFGSVALVIAGFQIVLFILSVAFCCVKDV